MIEKIKNLSYEERLNKLRLTIFEARRIRLDFFEVFNIIKGFEGLNENEFFERSEKDFTRGHSYKFLKKRVIRNYGLYSFGNRIVTYCNRLPDTLMKLN